MNEQMVMVPAGALAMIKNALKRDAEEGRQVRGEMVAELDARTITDPAAMAAELGKMMGQEAAAFMRLDPNKTELGFWIDPAGGVLWEKSEPLYRVPQPTPDYAVAIERAAKVCSETESEMKEETRQYPDEGSPDYANGFMDGAIRSMGSIRALMPAGVEVFESDGTISVEAIAVSAERAGKRVYIVTAAP